MTSCEQFEQFFRDADTDNSGELSLDELIAMMRKNGFLGTDAEIKAMFSDTDTSGDNQVSLEEFLVMVGEIPEKDHKKANMMRVFKSFDKDGNGTIDKKELKAVFDEMGRHLSDKEVARMMELCSGRDTMNYEEFTKQCFL